MRYSARSLLVLFLALLAVPLHADDVLFIGNSFTYAAMAPLVELHGGVPKLFDEIALAKGRKVHVYAVTKGGKDWAYHLEQPETAKALATHPWTWVVLQDYSTRPTHAGNVADFMHDGETFSDRIAAASPKAGVILYETWARPAGSFYSATSGHDFSGPAQMMAELHDSYGRLREDLATKHPDRDTRVAPVGTAFARAEDLYPGIDLNALDQHHATAEGYYLAALVIYETIYHESVKGAPTEFFHGVVKFPPAAAANLQAVADEVAGTPAK